MKLTRDKIVDTLFKEGRKESKEKGYLISPDWGTIIILVDAMSKPKVAKTLIKYLKERLND